MKKPYIFNSADWREILGKDYFLKCISEEKKENSSVKVCCLMHLQIKHTRCYHVIKFLVIQEREREVQDGECVHQLGISQSLPASPQGTEAESLTALGAFGAGVDY